MTRKSAGSLVQHICRLAAVQTARELGDRELLERFVAQKDEAAFAVLVERHGRMILGVCRRLLGSTPDAEDACQTTFLVLAQKAASIRKTTSLPSWLHGVAARVAAHVRRQRGRRCKREQESPTPTVADPAAEVTWREVQTILDEELERLPENLRGPLILCYLDGRTRDEAARHLGLSVACLHGRLERGRKTLCQRLTRRGVTLSATLLAAAVGEGVSWAALSPALVLHTAKAAVLILGGRAPDQGLVSAKILSLSHEVARNMLLSKLKLGASAFLCAGLLATALAGSLASLGAGEPAKAPPAASPSGAADDKKPESPAADERLSGRVLDPDGKPAAGAKVYLLQWDYPPGRAQDKAPPKVWAETDKDGRFSFTAPRHTGELFITAAGLAPGWETTGHSRSVVRVGSPEEPRPAEDLVVRLARDDVPVSGRLLDLQGEPIAGASVRVFALKASAEGSLDKWIAAVKNRTLGQDVQDDQYLAAFFVDGLAHFFPPVTTDKDGRFRLQGIGRERLVAFTVEGPAIETRVIHVVTRPGVGAADLRVPENTIFFGGGQVKELRLKPYYPPTFTHTADPCRVVTGVVRDKASGKPIAGAVVRGDQPVRYPVYYNRTTTDKEGRYRLTGMPLTPDIGRSTSVVVLPPAGEPYLALRKTLPADKEAKEAAFDFDLPRGVWLEGQVKDKATGRGVPALLSYMIFEGPQPRLMAEPYYRDPFDAPGNQTDKEGKFRLLGAPERGLLGASAVGEMAGRYRVGVGADKIEGTIRGETGPIRSTPFGFSAEQFDTLVEVKPEKGATSLHCDLELDPGRTLTIQVRGPDGKPQDSVRAYGQSARLGYPGWSENPLPAEFTAYGLGPNTKRTLLLEHPEKNLGARYEIKGDEGGPIAVTLQPTASVVGRLVDDDGRPLAHADVAVQFGLAREDPPRQRPQPRQVRTDAEGKFRIDGLIAGMSYHGYFMPRPVYLQLIFDNVSLKSGDVKDLGDVKVTKGDS